MAARWCHDGPGVHMDAVSPEHLECRICYWTYSLGSRRPKVLGCGHRLCAKCLSKILVLGQASPDAVACPFCRSVTKLPGEAVKSFPDDRHLVSELNVLQESTTELLLSPERLSSLMSYSSIRSSPNFVVITIMEPPPPLPPPPPSRQDLHVQAYSPDYSRSSLSSRTSIRRRRSLWNCTSLVYQSSARALAWLLGLMYFSSLPTGVYLLLMQRTALGALLVSLVPASLVLVMVYGLVQCVFHEVWDCVTS